MVYDLVIPVLAIQARDSDGRKRADHPTTRERKPRAHRRVPEGDHVAREPLAAGPRRGPGLYPDDPRGRRHGQDSHPAVLPRTDRPPRGERLLPEAGARGGPQHRGGVHAGRGEGDRRPPEGSQQDDRQGRLRTDGRQGRSHPAMNRAGVADAGRESPRMTEKGNGWEPVMKGWDARLQWSELPSGLPRSVAECGGRTQSYPGSTARKSSAAWLTMP